MIVGLVLIVGAGVNYQYATSNPGGVDFLQGWVAARAYLLEGRSPYSSEVTEEIQERIYGRPARPEEGESTYRFAYPLYAIAFMAPTSLLDFTLARAVWMTILEICIVLTLFAGLRLAQWRVGAVRLIVLTLFALFWYYGLRTVIVGQFAGINALFLVLAILLIVGNQDVPAGVFLALSASKPQMSYLLILLAIIWALSRGRIGLVLSTVVTGLALLLISVMLINDWPVQLLRQLIAEDFVIGPTPLSVLAARVPGIQATLNGVLHVVAVLYLLIEWVLVIRKDVRWFVWTAMLTLVITVLITPHASSSNLVVLIIVFLLVFRIWEQRWKKFGTAAVGLSALLRVFGVWGLFLATVQGTVESPAMLVPIPILCLFGLWWVRWWALRPAKLLLEDLAEIMG